MNIAMRYNYPHVVYPTEMPFRTPLGCQEAQGLPNSLFRVIARTVAARIPAC